MQTCLELIPDDVERVFVAYSGGLDSSVLLYLLVSKPRSFRIIPWHFNHGLQELAADMEKFCIEQARNYELEIRVDKLDLENADSNIEAEARQQRYRLLEQHCRTGDVVLTAHHLDDQAETFLLNALRGSGSAGLRGIARQRRLGEALLLRPLLGISRNQLEQYAAANDIAWVNDPSNKSDRFDRNYMRNQVLPLVQKRWPRFQSSLSTCCELQSETQQLLDEIAQQDYLQMRNPVSSGFSTLDVAGLLKLSPGRCKNLLRYWITNAGLSMIPHARLQELMNQLHAQADALPEIAMPEYVIRLYDQRLFLVPEDSVRQHSGVFEFDLNPDIEIIQYELVFTRQAVFEQIGMTDQGQSLSLRFRDQGQPDEDRHRLKRLFQKHRVPPWERNAVAQVYLDGKLSGILP
jgi:tRNA(Ile)-lysidine synthase